jgi:hypothetical protein
LTLIRLTTHWPDEVQLSSSAFGISDDDAEVTAAFRKKSQFVFERPLSAQSIHKTLKPAYEMILRKRRRYFRCPISVPVVIQRKSMQEVRCNTEHIRSGIHSPATNGARATADIAETIRRLFM